MEPLDSFDIEVFVDLANASMALTAQTVKADLTARIKVKTPKPQILGMVRVKVNG